MTDWGFGEWCGAAFAALVFIYLGARLASHAFFKSKQQHEQQP